jgi:hypothetical protein
MNMRPSTNQQSSNTAYDICATTLCPRSAVTLFVRRDSGTSQGHTRSCQEWLCRVSCPYYLLLSSSLIGEGTDLSTSGIGAMFQTTVTARSTSATTIGCLACVRLSRSILGRSQVLLLIWLNQQAWHQLTDAESTCPWKRLQLASIASLDTGSPKAFGTLSRWMTVMIRTRRANARDNRQLNPYMSSRFKGPTM